MNFDLTEEQIGIVKAVREFCAKEFKPELGLELDKKEEFPLELYRQAAKLGFTSLSFPEEYGGQGYGLLETCLAIEEMCRADSSLGVAVSSGNFGSLIRWLAISMARSPESRTTPMPPRPGGVEMATMVSSLVIRVTRRLATRVARGRVGRNNHHLAFGSHSFALRADLRNVLQGHVNDAPLARVHGAEGEGIPSINDAF